jgi:non-homologous end joining protein Ku
LQKVVDRKRKGQEIEVPEEVEAQPTPVPDLMAALEESLKDAKKGRSTKGKTKASA